MKSPTKESNQGYCMVLKCRNEVSGIYPKDVRMGTDLFGDKNGRLASTE